MVLFTKKFWATILSITFTFFAECLFAGIFLLIYLAIYYATDYEPLNTGAPVFFAKGFLILLPSVYNIKKIITAYKAKDFVATFGFLNITLLYSACIALLGDGGR